MNTFNLDFANNAWIFNQKSIYPEWVASERFFNCENFNRTFANRDSLFGGLFARKALKK